MTVQNRTVLKSYFQRGLRPTQSNYGDLIDSFALVSASVSAAGSNGQVQYNNNGVLGGFTVSGDAASLSTAGVLTLANTGVSAGTYANPTVTFDSKGRAVSASSSTTSFVNKTIRTFTANDTYTPSAGMLYCEIEVIGGGGGGGGANTTNGAVGGGGGAGGYAKKIFSAATIGASQSVTIGAAGSAGAAGGSGGAGGTTSVGSLISATGGNGGTGATSASSNAIGGDGGVGSSGDINQAGMPGDPAIMTGSAAQNTSGNGGGSFFGGGAKGVISAIPANGNSGLANSGGGGSGAASGGSAQTGGAGGSGYVIISEYRSQ